MQKGMFQKCKEIISKPSSFFKSLDEKGVKAAFYYSAVLSLVSLILGLGYGFLTDSTYSTIWGYLVLYWPFSVALNFLIALILHLFVKLFRGKGPYSKTYQLYIYASTPSFLLGWIPYVSFLGSVWMLVLLVIGTMHMHKLSRARTIWLYAVVLAFELILLLIGYWLTFLFLGSALAA